MMRILLIAGLLLTATAAQATDAATCAELSETIYEDVEFTRGFSERIDGAAGPVAEMNAEYAASYLASILDGVELARALDWAKSYNVLRVVLDDYMVKLDALSGAISACAQN